MSSDSDKDIDLIGVSTPATTPKQTPADNLGSGVNFFDHVLASTKFTEKQVNKKHKSLKFNGLVVDANKITSEELLMRTSESFHASISKGADLSSGIIEYKVFIPEVTGLYPTLDLSELFRFQFLKENKNWYENSSPKSPKDQEYFEENMKEMLTYLRKINRYPCFYISAKDNSMNTLVFCEVKFPDENKMFYGEYMKTLNNFDNPTLKAAASLLNNKKKAGNPADGYTGESKTLEQMTGGLS